MNFVVVVVPFIVLKVYDLHLEYLFLVSGLKQKCQKCHVTCQINGPVIYFSDIRALHSFFYKNNFIRTKALVLAKNLKNRLRSRPGLLF